ncbi:MAG: cytochrome P450 [Halioglobus sp.]
MTGCPYANLLDPNTYGEGMPYEELARLRQAGSMVKLDDPINGVPYWVAGSQKSMDFVSKNPALFSSAARSAWPQEDPQEMVEAFHQKSVINMDPPLHQRMRRVIRGAFTPKAVASYEANFRAHAKQIIDQVAKSGACEFVEEVAAELPLIAILELLGVPTEERKQFYDWTNTMIFAEDPDMATSPDEANVAAFEMIQYAMGMAEQHKIEPLDNMTGVLLDGVVDGRPISEEEFGWMWLLTMVGGNESTRTVISQGMRLLMEHPDQLQYLVENPDRIGDAVEEILRFNTAFICMRRTAMEDVEVDGHQVKAGDKIILHYHSANQDESVFGDDALSFDVRRAERMPDLYNQLRSFGIGQHFCIGSHVARLELQVMFEEIIPRLRNPKLVGQPEYAKSFFINGIKRMPITFDSEVA